MVDHDVAKVPTLGPIVSVHLRRNLERSRWLLRLGWAALMGVPVAIVLGITFLALGVQSSGMVLLGLGALAMLPTMLFTFVFTLSEDLPCLAIYERGFALHNTKGLKTVQWDELRGIQISAFRFENSQSINTQYILTGSFSPPISISERMERYGEAIATIENGFQSILSARISDARRSGQPMSYGAVSLDREGIRIGTLACPWSAAVSYELKRGFWILHYRTGTGGTASLPVPVRQIENYRVFDAELAAMLTPRTH